MKNGYHRLLLAAFIALIAGACEKVGPQGPEGPEGPPGNPGTGGSGSGNPTVVAYTTEGSGIDRFYWQEADESITVSVYYQLKAVQGSKEYPLLSFMDTTNQANDANILVYLKLIDSDGGQTWRGLPVDDLGGTMGIRYSADVLRIAPVATDGIYADKVTISVGAVRFNDPRYPPAPPNYGVAAVRVVIIPTGSEGEIGKKSSAALKNLSFEQVMEKYGIKESAVKLIK